MGRSRVRRCAAAVVFLLALLVPAADAGAQYFGRNKVHYASLDFRVLQTAHFDIYYYPEEELATRQAARMAERWYLRLSRVLDHRFTHRQPIVLYASHPHFTQTNITAEAPGEGTGGLTERHKSRIAMPFAAGLGETDHVLGHEISHAFQIDVMKSARGSAFSLPGWFIEGMAEYLSLGPVNTNTEMWLRDAALFDRLPDLDQLDAGRYFPYRFGHAFWSYLSGRFGEAVITHALRSRKSNPIERIEEATGLTRAELASGWHDSISTEGSGRPRGIPRPRVVLAARNDTARLHMAPALSPDGTQLMYLSERDRLSVDLFLADAATGAMTRKILSTAADPHFDSLQYIQSSGAWDPAGRRFALSAVSGGNPVLLIVDVASSAPPREVLLPGIGEAYNPSWSPDGTRIVFAALKGGFSDLFIYTLATGAITPLTADAFADLQPAWSPDGRTIALATDRFTSSVDTLEFGPLRIGLLDLATRIIRPAVDTGPGAKQVSPQWAPDGSAIYFISDRSSISNVYRATLASGEIRQVTAVSGGVSGITATSPALAVAARAGTLAFSVYRNGRYEIQALDAARAAGGLVIAADEPDATLTVADPLEGTLAHFLADAALGLPDVNTFTNREYDDRLRLETLVQPYIGATTGNAFGGLLNASLGFVLGDTLRNRQLTTLVRAGTARDAFSAQFAYSSLNGRWNWGVTGGFSPSRFAGARRSLLREAATTTREISHLRYDNQWAGITSRYNIDRGRRLEFNFGIRRTGYDWQTQTRVIDSASQETLSRLSARTSAGRPVALAEGDLAFVRDTAATGPTGPVLGQRLRLEVSPAIGGLTYAAIRADLRRYFLPIRPVTIAVRMQHSARYGPDGNDPRLTPLFLGLQSLVRGYDIASYAVAECGRAATSCSLVDELAGSRVSVVNVELRAPALGLLTGDLDYGRVPVDLIAFADAGFLTTRTAGQARDRDRFRSIGAGARVNVGGMVFEMTAARPFDRADKRWTLSMLLRQGF